LAPEDFLGAPEVLGGLFLGKNASGLFSLVGHIPISSALSPYEITAVQKVLFGVLEVLRQPQRN